MHSFSPHNLKSPQTAVFSVALALFDLSMEGNVEMALPEVVTYLCD